jgi:hypothetical protein
MRRVKTQPPYLAPIANQSQQRKPATDAYFEPFAWHEGANLLAEMHRGLWISARDGQSEDLFLRSPRFFSAYLSFLICVGDLVNIALGEFWQGAAGVIAGLLLTYMTRRNVRAYFV